MAAWVSTSTRWRLPADSASTSMPSTAVRVESQSKKTCS